MKNLWIIADAQQAQEPSILKSEQISEGDAVTTVPSDANTAGARPGARPYSPSSLIFIVAIFVMMYVILFRGPRKKQQKHQQMVKSLKKNDKVRTIGGIIGTVVNVKDDEITLKVDESNNTKIKVAVSAIGKNLSQD